MRALEAVVNPTDDGALERTTVTLQSLKHWQDIHAGLLQHSMGNVSALSSVSGGRQLKYGFDLGLHRCNSIEIMKQKKN